MPNASASILRSIVENNPTGLPAVAPVDLPPSAAPGDAPADDSESEAKEGTLAKIAPGHAGHLKILVENAPIAMAMFDSNMRYLLANRRWIDDFKLQNVEIIGRSQYEIFPSLHPGWRHVYERSLQGQVVRSDRDAITRDGQKIVYRWEVRPWRHVDTTVGGVMVTCERLIAGAGHGPETTEKKSAPPAKQDALWESALPMVAMDSTGRILRASHGAAGYFHELGSGTASFWQAFGELEPDGPVCQQVRAALGLALAKPSAQTLFSVPQDSIPSGRGVPANWQLSVVRGGEWSQEGGAVMAIGLLALPTPSAAPQTTATPFALAPEASPTMMGIALEASTTQTADPDAHRIAEELARLRLIHKEACDNELTARQREARLRSVLDVLPFGMIVLDERGRPIYHNNAVTTMLGHGLSEGQSVEEWLAKCCRDEQHTDEVIRQWREGVWRKQLTRILALSGTDGLLKEIEFTPGLLAAGGFVITLRDVTEARRSEEMLRGAEAKFRTLVHEAPLPVIMTDRAGAVFDVNAPTEMLLGYSRAELRRMPIERWLTPDAAKSRAIALREMSRCGARSTEVPVELVNREDVSVPVLMRLASVPDANGAPQYTIHYIQELEVEAPEQAPEEPKNEVVPVVAATPRKKREPRTAMVPVSLLCTDVNGRVESWSEAATELFGHETQEALGRGLHQWFRPSDATGFYAHLAELLNNGEPETAEWMFLHKTEGRKMGTFSLKSLTDEGLSVEISIDKEVTIEEEDLEPEMEALVSDDPHAEAESSPDTATSSESADPAATPVRPAAPDLKREMLLLGETHHRVKNHLQIITSMLNLQISTVHNEEARDALRSSQNRVRSIAALHQHLYQLASGDTADFSRFASGLISHLLECYDVEEERVAVELNLSDTIVPEEWLMPLALSLNEMVSNALKHAFPRERQGSIKVELNWGDERGELTVTDDGVGLPESFDDTAVTGLGLKIMRVFAGQLGGEVVVSSDPGGGASFSLRFPLTVPQA